MKIRTKLLIAFMLTAIIPLATLSLFVQNQVAQSSDERLADHLATVRDDKSHSIQYYFKNIESQLRLMGKSETVVKALNKFDFGFERLDRNPKQEKDASSLDAPKRSLNSYYQNEFLTTLKENNQEPVSIDSLIPKSNAGIKLQSSYISDNQHPLGSKNNLEKADGRSYYDHVHSKYHSYFNRFLQEYGFYDIFLVEPENGNVIYSVYKEIDFATSLKTGPFANSGLAKAFNVAMKESNPETVSLIDFDKYLPSYNAPASFMSTAVRDRGKIVGVLILQMPIDLINSITNERVGLGETGKAYLTGENDGLLRTQLAFYEENSILELGSNSDLNYETLNANEVLEHKDHFGNDVVSSGHLVDVLGLKWRMIVEKDISEANHSLYIIERALLIAFGICLILIAAVVLWLTRNLQKQLGAEPDFLNTIASEIADGDLSREFDNVEKQSGTLKVMSSMQTTLKKRDESDKKTMVKILQLQHGLQKLSTPVMLSNHEHNITFTNDAMQELVAKYTTEFRSVVPALNPSDLSDLSIAQFNDDQNGFLNQLNNMRDGYNYELKAGSRTFEVIVSAIRGEDGERVASSLEWNDVTEERRVMQEVDSVVESAHNGELCNRVNLKDKNGIYLGLSEKVNGLLDVTEEFVTEVTEFLGGIADGNLAKRIDKEYSGDFANVKSNANRSASKLMEVMENIRSVAGTVDTAAREINTGNLDLSQRTERAAASLEETSSSMEEMTASVAQNADNSKQANQLALAAKEHAEKGGDVVGEAVIAMKGINESSHKIADIIGVIDDIAFQTNLLALNASVEAARAGEQGRGFAVVASEVRNLAGRSATAAKEIKDLIEDSVGRVKNGAELVNESGKTLEGIVSQVKKVTDIVSEISAASQEQAEGITLVNNAISQLDDATQQNAALVEEASAASQSTTEQAASLIGMIGFFSTDGKSGSTFTRESVAKVESFTPVNSVANVQPIVPAQPMAPSPIITTQSAPANAPTHAAPQKVANSDSEEDWEEF